MREAFARWAKPGCNPVTRPPSEGLQENDNDISDVTLVTHVTLKKQQAQFCMGAGPVPAVQSDLSKSGVTWVTRVTCHESLDISCNPTRRAGVTGLQNQAEAQTTSSALLAQGGEVAAVLTADPPLPPLPAEAEAEVGATVARLVVGGWEPAKARLLAPALVARRMGLPEPPEPALPEAVLAGLLAGLARGTVQ